MADIFLRANSLNQVTCVSNIFIDNYMKDANGEYVKIFLYLLRCIGRDGLDFSISAVADHLDHTEKDVMRALTYWEKVGLLHLEYSNEELVGICLTDFAGHDQALTPVSPSALSGIPVPTKEASPMKPSYSADQISEFSSQDSVKELLFVAQQYIGKPLSQSDTNSILYWYDVLHMSTDLIEYLIETCVDNGHKSFHYMDSVARNWCDDGITTIEQASKSSKSRNTTVYSIMKALGLSGREPIDAEIDFMNKWTNKWNFSMDIICEACTRTVLQTNKNHFKYADGILSNWKNANVSTLEDIKNMDEAFVSSTARKLHDVKESTTPRRTVSKTGFHNLDQREYDYSALEQALINQ